MSKNTWIESTIKEVINELENLHTYLFIDENGNQEWTDDYPLVHINVMLFEICSYLEIPLISINVEYENNDITSQISHIIGRLKKLL